MNVIIVSDVQVCR